MKLQIYVSLAFLLSISILKADQIQEPSFQNADRIQLYELCAHIRSTYHLLACYEDIGENSTQDLDSIFYNQRDFDFSKLSLSEVLNRIANSGVSFKVNDKFLIFRPQGYNTHDSPLELVMPSFKFSGSLGALVTCLATNNPSILFTTVATVPDRSLVYPMITMRFDSPVSLESILCSLTDQYGIMWHVTTYKKRKYLPTGQSAVLSLEFLP